MRFPWFSLEKHFCKSCKFIQLHQVCYHWDEENQKWFTIYECIGCETEDWKEGKRKEKKP